MPQMDHKYCIAITKKIETLETWNDRGTHHLYISTPSLKHFSASCLGVYYKWTWLFSWRAQRYVFRPLDHALFSKDRCSTWASGIAIQIIDPHAKASETWPIHKNGPQLQPLRVPWVNFRSGLAMEEIEREVFSFEWVEFDARKQMFVS